MRCLFSRATNLFVCIEYQATRYSVFLCGFRCLVCFTSYCGLSSSKTMTPARSSDRRDWPLPPLTWDPPRLGWPDSPQKRTPQKRRYSQETSEPALEGRARCARTEASSTNVEYNLEKIKFARRVSALWSPVFAFSDFDDASTGQ